MTSPGRSFGIPVLYSLHSLQQGVMASGGVGGLSTVVTMAPMQQAQLTTLSAMTQSPVPQLNTAPPITETPSLPTAQLYLCRTSNNATEPPSEEGEGGKEKASLELLQHDYDNLNSRKIKDSLSSFLPDIPGDFDSVGTTNTMLKNLLEQRTIGNRDFLPLSGQALLGFRLLPGALPEQYRIDPPSLESKHHHKRKKHKRKQIEKLAEDNGDLGPPAPKAKMPSDAFAFLKQEPQHTHYPPSQPHMYPYHGAPPSQGTSVIQQSTKPVVGSHALSQPISAGATVVASGAVASGFVQGVGHQYIGEKRKKEKKKNKEKKEKKKEKKKKRDKHHAQEPPGPGAPPPGGGTSGPTLAPHPQVTYGSFPHT